MNLIKQFSKPDIDFYIMPHTCYGNTENMIYIKELARHYEYNFDTGELYRTHLPNATHYHHEGHLYSSRHAWHVTHPVSIFFIDGEEVASYKTHSAHDRTFYHNGTDWILYTRKYPVKENKIFMQRSSDFINWNEPKEVKMSGLFQNEMIYSFGTFQIGEDWYAVGNIFTDGDPFHSPNYHDHEYRIYPKAFKLSEMGWRLFPGMDFSKIVGDLEQCFINICVKGEDVYITTQDSYRKHATYCNIHEMKTKPVSSRILRMDVTELLS